MFDLCFGLFEKFLTFSTISDNKFRLEEKLFIANFY